MVSSNNLFNRNNSIDDWIFVRLSKADEHECEVRAKNAEIIRENISAVKETMKPDMLNSSITCEDLFSTGFKGEVAFSYLYDLPKPSSKVATDGLVDFWVGDISVQVKTIYGTQGNLIIDTTDNFCSDVCSLISEVEDGNGDLLYIVQGWITRKDFLEGHEKTFLKKPQKFKCVYNPRNLRTPESLWKYFKVNQNAQVTTRIVPSSSYTRSRNHGSA